MPSFSDRSKNNLNSCHPDLIELFLEVVKVYDCSVLVGHRNEVDQGIAFMAGNSKVDWPNSKHNTHPSLAVDIMPYPIDWEDLEGQHRFATTVYDIAMKNNIRVRWGGMFKNFYDSPHWQLI